jgi:diacylglycerol kinase family enzyme
MYYYIMESANKKNLVWQEKVKDILGDIGIAGETVTPSAARTIEELASLGLAKGYSTIVAVGTEKIVNKIVNCIINQKENPDVVLGIIPENYDSPLAKMIRVTDLKSACNTLKYRKLQSADACFIEPNKYFLTEAILSSGKPLDAYLITPEIKAGVVFDKIVIKPGLEIDIFDSSPVSQPKKIFGWLFGKKEETHGHSYFHTNRAKIEAVDGGVAVKAEDEIIAKTPIICHNRPKALKIIVARDIMEEKER